MAFGYRTFGQAFNQRLEKVTLPSGLRKMTFSQYSDQSLEKVILPSSLLRLT